MRKVAYIATWRNTVVMAMATGIVATVILATGIVATTVNPATGIVATTVNPATGIAATVILMGGTSEGTTAHTTGLIPGAIMATHMAATTAGIIKESGLASVTKTEECGPKRAGVEAPAVYRLYF
jgi:hypothetical protein